MILVSALFFVLFSVVVAIEHFRKPDLMSIFVIIFSLQIIIPGIFIPLCLIELDRNEVLGNFFFDLVYSDVTLEVISLSFFMALFFLFFLYLSYFFITNVFSRKIFELKGLVISYGWVCFFIFLGLLSSALLISFMPGESVFEKYSNLVLFRAQDEYVAQFRNFITANLFSMTQAFAIFSVLFVSIFYSKKGKINYFLLIFSVLVLLFFGVMAVSRRMLAIQILLLYFSYVLYSRKHQFIPLLFIGGIFFPVLVFGKDVLAQLSSINNETGIKFGFDLSDFAVAFLNGLSSLGISLNSSWATFMYMEDFYFRLGSDHVFSAFRFLPLNSIGIDESTLFPERVVRLSTRAFSDGDQQDIPPGLFGQMWLDFGFLGALFWGVGFGIFVAMLQLLMNRFSRSFITTTVFSIVVFVVALPLNSGSLDFSFSVDILFLFFMLFLSIRVFRSRISSNFFKGYK